MILRGDDVHIQGSNGENMVNCNEDGSVDISFNNVKKFETTSGGAKVTGELQMGGTAGVKFSHSGTSSKYESQTAGDELLFKTTPSGGSSTTALTYFLLVNHFLNHQLVMDLKSNGLM